MITIVICLTIIAIIALTITFAKITSSKEEVDKRVKEVIKKEKEIETINGVEVARLEDYGYKEYKTLKKVWKVFSKVVVVLIIALLYLSIFVIAYNINTISICTYFSTSFSHSAHKLYISKCEIAKYCII